MANKYPVERLNENTLMVTIGHHIAPSLPLLIANIRQHLLHYFPHIILDTVPSYTTLMIVFDDKKVNVNDFQGKLIQALHTVENTVENRSNKQFTIPVFYDASTGPDLFPLAEYHQLSVDDVIHMHSGVNYRVYAVGFAPGFAYLGEVNPRIATPRHPTPRHHVAGGSLGIADTQTGIYPNDSPGGWNIIGRTPLNLLDKSSEPFCQINCGDDIRFIPITHKEFTQLQGQHLPWNP